jgi:transposase
VNFINGSARDQISPPPACVDDYVSPDALVRVVDAFVASLNLGELGFGRAVAAATGSPRYHSGDLLRQYVWQVRSSRQLERACVRDFEALWPYCQFAPDYRTITSFRHDNREAIVGASAAFAQFCREAGLISARLVALDGTKMRAVASPKYIAGAERLARDARTPKRKSSATWTGWTSLMRRWLRVSTISQASGGVRHCDQDPHWPRGSARSPAGDLEGSRRYGSGLRGPDARPMGYGRSPKTPCYNMQSVVDVGSGLIIHHDVANETNDSQLLHPTSMAAIEGPAARSPRAGRGQFLSVDDLPCGHLEGPRQCLGDHAGKQGSVQHALDHIEDGADIAGWDRTQGKTRNNYDVRLNSGRV